MTYLEKIAQTYITGASTTNRTFGTPLTRFVAFNLVAAAGSCLAGRKISGGGYTWPHAVINPITRLVQLWAVGFTPAQVQIPVNGKQLDPVLTPSEAGTVGLTAAYAGLYALAKYTEQPFSLMTTVAINTLTDQFAHGLALVTSKKVIGSAIDQRKVEFNQVYSINVRRIAIALTGAAIGYCSQVLSWKQAAAIPIAVEVIRTFSHFLTTRPDKQVDAPIQHATAWVVAYAGVYYGMKALGQQTPLQTIVAIAALSRLGADWFELLTKPL